MFKTFSFLLLLFSSTTLFAGARTILVYGDSLSAGFGIAVAQSWPALLGQRLKQNGSNGSNGSNGAQWTVVNASISGETTAGGRSRLDAALKQFQPQIVILALGANDGLRGLPVKTMSDNLAAMVAAAKKQKARVLLVGMRLPPNYGPDYTRDFETAFSRLSQREKLPLLPFLLEPIAGDRNAFQNDNLHPLAAAQPKLLEHVWKSLKPMLDAGS
jgi:acyl-CoA thioesterase-1